MLQPAFRSLIDSKQQATVLHPDARIYLYSRWDSESDSALVLDDPGIQRIDISAMVKSASLTLELEGQSASLNLTFVANDLPPQVFYNCLVKVYEGYTHVPESEWPQTFTGFHMGQPGVRGSSASSFSTDPEDLMTGRNSDREITVVFQSRDQLYKQMETTSHGAWRPQISPDNSKQIPFRYYDPLESFDEELFREYDDVGMIVREMAINDIWGMGLRPEEVAIGKIGYRIQKKLQVVQQNVWQAITDMLYTMHLVPYFTGSGVLSYRSYDLDKSPVRSYYDGSLLGSTDQSSAALEDVNVVVVTGLDNEVTPVYHEVQRMSKSNGTTGWFDLHNSYHLIWAADEQKTVRARNPSVRNASVRGIFGELSSKFSVESKGDFEYVVHIDQSALKIVQMLALLGLMMAAAIAQSGAGPSLSGSVGVESSIGRAIESQLLMILIVLIIGEIGTYEFEVWAQPFEMVYRELKAEARLSHFGVEAQGLRRFAYEERKHEIDNKIFSSIDQELLADGSTNRGLRDFAREELRLKLAKNARRELRLTHDILLEPGDVVEDKDARRYYITSIGRGVGRFVEPMMTVQAFRIK